MQMNLFNQHLGERIARARVHRQMTREHLAIQLAIEDAGEVYRIETGNRDVTAIELQRIANLLGVPASYLLGDEPLLAWSIDRQMNMAYSLLDEQARRRVKQLVLDLVSDTPIVY